MTADEKPKKSKKTDKSSAKPGIKVTLKKSLIGSSQQQRKVVQGLGLRKLHHTVELQDTPEIRGMVRKVAHLVELAEL